MNPLPFLLVCIAGWMNHHQQLVIEYLQEEVRVLKEQLGRRPRFKDDQRRRLAVRESPSAEKLSSTLPVSSLRTRCSPGIGA